MANWNDDLVKITRDLELPSLPTHVIDAARRAAAARALGRDDCALLLDILGLGVSGTQQSSSCLRCGKEHARRGVGRTAYFCSKQCYLDTLRDERAARTPATMVAERFVPCQVERERPIRPTSWPNPH